MTGPARERICTPASCAQRPTVAVLGAGVAGLTAAHELAERGFVVTVYEARPDERTGIGSEPAGTYPPVKLGGLAASQYSTVGTGAGPAGLRPFPGRRGQPRAPRRAVAGEHGFRFFPAFYLHIWDLFQRIPVYERTAPTDWTLTSRTVYDNVRRVVTKGITVDGAPTLVFPSELPHSPAELLGTLSQLATMGFTPGDIATYQARLIRYLSSSPLRRARELQNVSAYDYLVGHNPATGTNQFSYSARCDNLLRRMPRVLVALDSQWGDARTNLSTYLQLYLNMDRRDNKADGVLNGPTTEAWFDHWYRHLRALGVRFVRGAAHSLDPPPADRGRPPHQRSRATLTLTDGARVAPDYTVVAVDAPAAEYLAGALRAAGTGGTVARLDGFATSAPPPHGPLQPEHSRPSARRDPYAMDQLGRVPWDRFQTLCGIQFYFDTEFQLLRGHMLLTGTDWALSSVNQSGLWERRPALDRDGHVSVLSVDIGDFSTPSGHLLDESGQGKAARDCTPDEIAAEVWRQIVAALTSQPGTDAEAILPWPAWYTLDRGLTTEDGPGQGVGRVARNETPYLVPIVGDWTNRPGSDPWNPHGTSWTSVPTEDWWLADLEDRNVWQARHGGYQVHNNSVVFAGTWNKTFTRVTSMESACESGRHAVNAILDHYVWVASGGADRRENTTLPWEFPYGFLDQGLSSPIRLPTPAGDYCYVFDIENREPADTRGPRNLDTEFCELSLPHPMDTPPPLSALPGGLPMSAPDPNQQLLAHLQMWRDIAQQAMSLMSAMAANMPLLPGMTGPPGVPVLPGLPVAPPIAAPVAADYAQQLAGSLQAWRQYLEQAAGTDPGRPRPVPPDRDVGGKRQESDTSTSRPPDDVPASATSHLNDVPPGRPDGSASTVGPPRPWSHLVDVQPSQPGGSMIPGGFDRTGLFNRPAPPGISVRPTVVDGNFTVPMASAPRPDAPPPVVREHPAASVAHQLPATPFRAVMQRVTTDVAPAAPKSLFNKPG